MTEGFSMKRICILALGALLSVSHAQLVVSEKFIDRWKLGKIPERL